MQKISRLLSRFTEEMNVWIELVVKMLYLR
jgi:hypothetical protein